MDEHHNKPFDWKMFGATFFLVTAQGLVQYGVIVTEVNDLTRRMERTEQKLDDKMLSREEFEKRHQELERRVEEIRERMQRLEFGRPNK